MQNVIFIFLVCVLCSHFLLNLVQVQLCLVFHVLVVVSAFFGDPAGLEPLKLTRSQSLVGQAVQDEDRLFAVTLLQLAWREVDSDSHLPEAVQDVRDGRIRVVKLLRLFELLPRLSTEPGGQRREEVKLEYRIFTEC